MMKIVLQPSRIVGDSASTVRTPVHDAERSYIMGVVEWNYGSCRCPVPTQEIMGVIASAGPGPLQFALFVAHAFGDGERSSQIKGASSKTNQTSLIHLGACPLTR
jgi:hypothetical protein